MIIATHRQRGLTGWWDDFVKYNSADAWGSNVASLYGWLQYGNVPKLIEPSATDTPADIARKNQEAIRAAEASGDWSSEPRLGITASDLAALPQKLKDEADRYKWWLMGGAAAIIGVVVLTKRGGK